MLPDSARFEPSEIPCLAERLAAKANGLALTPVEALLLDPGGLFAQYHCYRAFCVSTADGPAARLVASVDARQNGEVAGNIGFIASTDPTALEQALGSAIRWLADAGVSLVRCPVQFSTWLGHRTVVPGPGEAGSTPTFPFEPTSQPGLANILAAAGFEVAHRAVSHLVDNRLAIAGTERCIGLMRAAGLSERPLNLPALDSELTILHSLASEIFRGSWGYTDISVDELSAFYRPLAPLLDPDLVRFLLDPCGEPVGFVFAYPDRLGRFILKTIGVLPDVQRAWPGVGSALIASVHRLAQARGLTIGIHAFMAEGSYAQRRSAGWGTWMRSYATFERAGARAA